MPLKGSQLASLIKTRYGLIPNLVIPKPPKVYPAGDSYTELLFEIPITLEQKTSRINISYYLPDWKTALPKDIIKEFSKRTMVNKAYAKALRRSRQLKKPSDARRAMFITKYFTEECTKMESCLYTALAHSLNKQTSLSEINLERANVEIAKELRKYIEYELIQNGLGDSELIQGLLVVPLKPDEIQQPSSRYSKYVVRTGVRLVMSAYGFILDIGREPTRAGRHVPYDAIYEWAKRYGIKPWEGSTFDEMVQAIARSIDKYGYEGNQFLHEAIAKFVIAGFPIYYFWKDSDEKIFNTIKRVSTQTKKKYRGFRRRPFRGFLLEIK
jgi:hypothetical protein